MAEYELIEVGDIAGVEAPAEGWKFHNDKGWIHGNPSFAYVSEKAGATVYFSETKNGRTIVQGFGGDRAKEDFYESYATFEKAKVKATYYLNAQYSSKAWKAANKKERSQPVLVEIGDIFYNSWGWEQTNVDFYQVVAKTAATVTLRRIGSESVETTSWASENCKPVKDAFLENKKEIKKRVQNYNGKAYIAFEHGSSGLWAGEKLYRSWYA